MTETAAATSRVGTMTPPTDNARSSCTAAVRVTPTTSGRRTNVKTFAMVNVSSVACNCIIFSVSAPGVREGKTFSLSVRRGRGPTVHPSPLLPCTQVKSLSQPLSQA